MNYKEMIDRIRKAIHQADPDAEAYLFGSRTRGDNHSNSNWDILILVDAPKTTNDIEDKFRDKLYDLELETGQAISIFIYPKQYWDDSLKYSPLYKNVKDESVRI